MTRRYSSISVETTLSTGISASATTMSVAAGTASALLGNQTLSAGNVDQFTLAIDPDTINEEIVFATALTADTFVISRGQAETGTAGVSGIVHSPGAKVKHVLTGNDLDFFKAAIQPATLTTKGDTFVATAAGAVTRLGVGTNGQVLTADSSEAKGVKWSSISATPRIGQVVQATTTSSTSTTSTTYVDATGMSATITPTSSTSKVLVTMNFDANTNGNPSNYNATQMQIVRDSTAIYSDAIMAAYTTQLTSGALFNQRVTMTFLDSPTTTSATTYKLQVLKGPGSTTAGINSFGANCSVILQEVLV